MSDKSLISLGDWSKPADTLIKKFSEAMGGAFKPAQIKRVAKAEVEAERIKVLGRIATTALAKRAIARLVSEETEKQDNIENVLRLALPEVKDDAKTQDVDHDWVVNFIDKVKLISNTDIQQIWSKILAGEANAPGSFSVRTINALASVDKKDAEAFSKLCNFTWSIQNSIPLVFDHEADIYHDNGVNFGSLTHLDSIGLVTFDGLNQFTRLGLPKKIAVQYHKKIFGIEFPLEDNKLDIGYVMFTAVGQELAKVIVASEINGLTKYVLEHWKKQSLIVTDPSSSVTPTQQISPLIEKEVPQASTPASISQ